MADAMTEERQRLQDDKEFMAASGPVAFLSAKLENRLKNSVIDRRMLLAELDRLRDENAKLKSRVYHLERGLLTTPCND